MSEILQTVLGGSALDGVRQFVADHKIHPILVNFTAALIPVSIFSDILGKALRSSTLRDVGWWSLCYAGLATPFTAISGWLYWMEDDNGSTGMLTHKWLGTSLPVVLLLLVAWRWRFFKADGWPGIRYLLAGSLAVAVLVYQGYLGGEQSFP